MIKAFKLSILKGLILSQCNISIYFCRTKNIENKNSYFQDLEKKSLPKIKWINVIHQPIKPMGKKSQNDFWLLIDMNLDFDLATHFHHTVWRDLIEITHRTGITLHRNKQFFTPWCHSITHGMNQTIT